MENEYKIRLTVQDINVIHSKTNESIENWILRIIYQKLYAEKD